MQIVECVPNFSEGRDKAVIEAIAKEIKDTSDVKLLDVDPGADTNRTVVTFVGTPQGVTEAAFKAIKKASELIDMSKHSGAHARMGATDVCPFIPVSGVTMEDCARIAEEVGERVGRELNIPVYLYEHAARSEQRRSLPDVRSGEYEGLAEKLKDPDWAPDFGPALFNVKSGATIIGAREFLIAYNVNLNTRDRKLANDIALSIREKGRLKRDKEGNVVKDSQGNKLREEGKLKATKAVGWYIEEYGIAQISININNYKITPFHEVYEECCKQAELRGLRVTGSELVGLIPKSAILDAGKYYLEKQGKSPGVPETELVFTAIKSMGLCEISPFVPETKIVEYAFKDTIPKLVEKSVTGFVDEVSMDSPAPGGGSVAALSGSLGAALAAMVANLTVGKKGYEEHFERLKKAALQCQDIKDQLLAAVDADTDAFNLIIAARRLPKKTDEQIVAREEAIQKAYKEAARVPMNTVKLCKEALEPILLVTECGNLNSITDAGVAAMVANAGVKGAAMNVKINLEPITDKEFIAQMLRETEQYEKEADAITQQVSALVHKQIYEPLKELSR
jgi:glutamate formiminotransferase/formiminotetrahydrofolate cyclodeaminase